MKELNETQIWLKIIERSEMLTPERLEMLIDECDQLCRIIGASLSTARPESDR